LVAPTTNRVRHFIIKRSPGSLVRHRKGTNCLVGRAKRAG
jgi:hypothetical protein